MAETMEQLYPNDGGVKGGGGGGEGGRKDPFPCPGYARNCESRWWDASPAKNLSKSGSEVLFLIKKKRARKL